MSSAIAERLITETIYCKSATATVDYKECKIRMKPGNVTCGTCAWRFRVGEVE